MNKEQFLEELAGLLSDISPSEKEEALEYYRQYFDDANVSDAEVIGQLGSPKSVADSIRAELADKELIVCEPGQESIEERMDKNSSFATEETVVMRRCNENREGERRQEQTKNQKMRELPPGVIVLLVVLAICASPVIVGLGAGLIGLLIGAAAFVIGIFIAVGACALAFGVAAVALLAAGLIKLFVVPAAGLLLIGACILCVGGCLLCALATVQLCIHVLPAFVMWTGKMIAKPFRKKGTVQV